MTTVKTRRPPQRSVAMPTGKRMREPVNTGSPISQPICDKLDKVAADHRATCAQVALAWIMARKGLTAPIASATNPQQLAELLGATKIALTSADIAELDSASA